MDGLGSYCLAETITRQELLLPSFFLIFFSCCLLTLLVYFSPNVKNEK